MDSIGQGSVMTIEASQTGLFAIAERKLGWIGARQRVLAQNIANADTPGYRARDVSPFSRIVGLAGIEPVLTNPLHLAGLSQPHDSGQGPPTERAPDGNSVGLEDQMTKVADDETSQAMVGNLWHSYMGMFMTALGHAG